jgi:prolyl-tRNA editing enzyme YbaK/EbsC (Cys-tRNA(Pro) deacylase)
MKDALAIHRWLLAHQIHHEIVRLPRTLTCSDDLPDVLGVPPETCVGVTVFEVTTRGDTEPVAVVSAIASPPRPALVGSLLGAREVRPASAFVVNSVTDYAAGLVCPLLLPDDLTVIIDQHLMSGLGPDDDVHTATGERRTAVRLRAIHLFNLIAGKPLDLSVPVPLRVSTSARPTSTA